MPAGWLLLLLGAAVVKPPKSSSPETVGVGFVLVVEAPHPAPRSLAVSLSGICIIEEGPPAFEVGSGGLPHALSPPQGSESTLDTSGTLTGGGDFVSG